MNKIEINSDYHEAPYTMATCVSENAKGKNVIEISDEDLNTLVSLEETMNELTNKAYNAQIEYEGFIKECRNKYEQNKNKPSVVIDGKEFKLISVNDSMTLKDFKNKSQVVIDGEKYKLVPIE